MLIYQLRSPDGGFDLQFSYPQSSSTCFLLYCIIEQLCGTEVITRKMAEALYVGMMTDTGNFSFSFLTPALYRALAVLVEKGIDVAGIHNSVYNAYTEGRARQLIDYIGSALESAPCVELWHVWQGGFYSFDERPVVHRAAVRFDEFVVDDLRELGETDLWNNKETNRLSFYCLTVMR